MSISLTGTITGLDADIKMLQEEVSKAMTAGMERLRADAESCLLDHLIEDVYGAYEPTEYIRRYADGGLLDFTNNINSDSDSDSASLEYTPSGESEQWNYPLDGDALIRRIETGKGYEWYRHPEERPFFQNFTTEMIDGCRAEAELITGMNAANPALGVTAETIGFERDGTEWEG